MLMAKLFQELKRHNKFPFGVQFLVMDPGYSPENRQVIETNAKNLNIPITIFESDIFESVFMWRNHLAICARVCGAVICIVKRRRLVVTRLP